MFVFSNFYSKQTYFGSFYTRRCIVIFDTFLATDLDMNYTKLQSINYTTFLLANFFDIFQKTSRRKFVNITENKLVFVRNLLSWKISGIAFDIPLTRIQCWRFMSYPATILQQYDTRLTNICFYFIWIPGSLKGTLSNILYYQ